MTDEELQREMQKISEGMDKLSDSERPLSKEEQRRKHLLLLKKETLLRIEEAREKNNSQQELKSSMDYAVLTTYGERHPFLLHLARIKFKGHIF